MIKLIIYPLLLIMFFTNCVSKKTLIIDRDENDVKQKSTIAIDKLSKENIVYLKKYYDLEYNIIKNDNTTTVNIYSTSGKLNNIISDSILQEYYLQQGGKIPLNDKYKKIDFEKFAILQVINAGLGLGYITQNSILSENKFFEYSIAGLYGLIDIGYLSGFVYGINKHDNDWIFIGTLGMITFKAIPFIGVIDINIHNSIINSGYNFDEKFNSELKAEISVKYRYE